MANMTQKQFIDKMLGVQWKNRAMSYDAVDCYGLVILYYRDVLGINIGIPPGYLNGDTVCDIWAQSEFRNMWVDIPVPLDSGVAFLAYSGEKALHTGITKGRSHVLHCRGNVENPGRVELHSIAAVRRFFGKITFHQYRG
jgi:hypothetical protein